jgi:hypothetical protein
MPETVDGKKKVPCPACGYEVTIGGETINKKKLVLAEDRDIHSFMYHACEAFGRSNEVQVLLFKSVSELGPYMRWLVDMPGFSQVETVVVARDVDTSVNRCMQSIKSAFESVETFSLPIPQEPFCFISNGNTKTACVLFPGPNTKGEYQTGIVEDLCVELIKNDKLYKNCVVPFVECAQSNQAEGETLKSKSKSEFYAFLAGKHRHAGLRAGVAARCKFWDWEDQRLVAFKKIIIEM